MFVVTGKFTTATVMLDTLDAETLKQIHLMVNHPAFTNPIIIMPDTHAGKGSVIGFTMKVGKFVVPNVVGVDIGCGMTMISFTSDRDIKGSLKQIDDAIRKAVPMGAGGYRSKYADTMKDMLTRLELLIRANLSTYRRNCTNDTRFNVPFNKALALVADEKAFTTGFLDKCNLPRQRFLESVGTLGGGNHFIELGELAGRYYITIHTGSRQVGLKVANAYQYIAKKQLEAIGDKWTFNLNDAAYLQGDEADEYLAAMFIAQAYAVINRNTIEAFITEAMEDIGIKIYDNYEEQECIHNFIGYDGIIRKGAISSMAGEQLIVPLTPVDGIIIGKGKGNPDWNCSAPHGAGRVMSRSQAKRDLSDQQVEDVMKGVYASCKPKDESPLAYKDPQLIIDAIGGTMDIEGIVKPLLNIKAMDTDE